MAEEENHRSLKFGQNTVTGKTLDKIDEKVGKFLGSEHKVVEVIKTEGRNSNGKHYQLNIDNERYVSIKQAHSVPEEIKRELFIHDMREKFNLPTYKVELQKGFPIPGWESSECILIDWGKIGKCKFVEKDDETKNSIQDNKEVFIKHLATVVVLNHLFAISDRKNAHMIWNLDTKELYSIDHELPADAENVPIANEFRGNIKRVLGSKWFDNKVEGKLFTDEFCRIWTTIENKKDEIEKIYDGYSLSKDKSKFVERLAKGSGWALQQLMM